MSDKSSTEHKADAIEGIESTKVHCFAHVDSVNVDGVLESVTAEMQLQLIWRHKSWVKYHLKNDNHNLHY